MPPSMSPEDRLGRLEARIVRDLWENGESAVQQVLDRLNAQRGRELAYTTVMSVMTRLAAKQILDRRRDGRAYLYRAALEPDELATHLARREARSLLADHGDAAIAGFVLEAGSDPHVLEMMRDALDQAEARQPDDA